MPTENRKYDYKSDTVRINNQTGEKEHRHSTQSDYWHPIDTKHKKRSKGQREQLISSPEKDKEKKDKERNPHKRYEAVSHKKFKSIKDRLKDRAGDNSGSQFRVPKFSVKWCLHSAVNAVAKLLDGCEALYNKYQNSPKSKGYKIIQFKTNGWENAMDKIDEIYPPGKEDWTFAELDNTRNLLSAELRRVYADVAKKYGFKSWQEGYDFLTNPNSKQYKQALKKDAQYLYAIREEAFVYTTMRKAILDNEKETQKYQEQVLNNIPKKKPNIQMNHAKAKEQLKQKQNIK